MESQRLQKRSKQERIPAPLCNRASNYAGMLSNIDGVGKVEEMTASVINETPGQAEVFFAQIQEGGVEFLKSLVGATPPTFENDWLDFKGGSHPSEKSEKKIWSEALSGFANTQGGVLIWGIDARKDGGTGVDCARALALVEQPDRFESRLRELQAQSTDPPVMNVEYWHHENPESPGKGFVACLVPQSANGPHRAEAAGRNYYIRAGDSFHVPSVSLLRRLFYPELHPLLWPELRPSLDMDMRKLHIECRLNNSGVATAKNVIVGVVIESDNEEQGGPHEATQNHWNLGAHPDDQAVRGVGFWTEKPLHPGASRLCFYYDMSLGANLLGLILPLTFKFSLYCENSEPAVAEITFCNNELADRTCKSARPLFRDPRRVVFPEERASRAR